MQQKPKHRIFGGDIIIIFAVALGALLSGSFYSNTSEYEQRDASEVQVITEPAKDTQSSLQLKTFDIQHCRDLTAIQFLIDNSGSMQFGSKMPELKKALKTFAANFPATGAISLQTYSEKVENRVPFGVFKDVKDKFLTQVDAMEPESATHSKDAFLAAQKSLKEGKDLFPNHTFSLVFISDGIPETATKNKLCPGGQNSPYCAPHPFNASACRCHDTDQDPSAVADEIKLKGNRIFTISFVDASEKKFDNNLQLLMMNVASTPNDYYRAPIETQLTEIITQISNRMCTSF